jgi:hypothetical protein
MCQLRRDFNPTVATGWQRPLPLQCLRLVLQDERAKQAAHQTKEEAGRNSQTFLLPLYVYVDVTDIFPFLLAIAEVFSQT